MIQNSRSLIEIELNDPAYKADFELSNKYQAFSAELLRLALLGVAGYGFLLSKIFQKDDSQTFFNRLTDFKPGFAIGILGLGLAAAFALAHRYFSTDCLAHQIIIFRLIKRSKTDNRTEEEQQTDQERLVEEKTAFKKDLKRCKWLLILSAGSLAIGLTAVVWAFFGVLLL